MTRVLQRVEPTLIVVRFTELVCLDSLSGVSEFKVDDWKSLYSKLNWRLLRERFSVSCVTEEHGVQVFFI